MTLYLCFSSCNRGEVSTEGPEAGSGTSYRENSGEIVLSREQFESSGMQTGLPFPMMFSNSIVANGFVVASIEGGAEISTLVSGRVKQINYSTGDYVKKGAVLFLLESNEIILLQQTYAEAFQELKLLQSDTERLKSLSEENIVAQKEYLRAAGEFKSLQAKVMGLKARLNMIDIDPSNVEQGDIVPYMSVKSPINGSITKQKLLLGQYIELNETPIEIIDTNELRLSLQVFENAIADLQCGQKVEFSTPDNPELKFKATLSKIGKEVSEESRSVQCFADIDGGQNYSFLNRMYVKAEIFTCEREVLALPEEALIREPDRDYILLLEEETDDQLTFRKFPVQTGVNRQGHVEILDKDLKTILVDGVYNLWKEE
jgi:cobalt-zinc-cadmium efflux system membrane fusion protein